IINHFLSIHKSVPKALPFGLHTIKDDGVLSRMKFVRIGEDVQEYGRAIPDAMLTDDIKQSETYQMFIKYSTGLIPLKKTRGKGLQGKKSAVSPKPASVEVSDESDFEPARKRTSSRRVIKKKVSISVEDNIIPEPYVALELGKYMSLTKAAKEEAARQVHATHERILKGVQTLTPEEQLVADTMQALKANRKSSRSQSLTGGLSEGTGFSPGVPNESTVILTTSSKGTEENVDEEIDWVYSDEGEEKKDDDDDDKSIDIEEADDEETNYEFVRDNVEKEMKDAEVAEVVKSRNGDEEITDTAKADAKKTKEVKDDNKKAELPPSSSSLFVSLGFGNQFLNLSSDKSIIRTLKDSADAEINSLLDVQIQQVIPQIQSPLVLTVPVLVISELVVLSMIPKIPTVTSTTTLPLPHYVSAVSPVLQQSTTPIPTPPITTEAPPVTTIPNPLPAISQRVSVLEKYVQELKAVDHTTALLASLRSKIPLSVNAYLGSSLGDALQKVLQKHTEELIHQYPQQVNYKDVIKESVQANVINEVKNLLPKFLPKAVSDFATPMIQSTVKKALEKTPTTLAQSSLKAAESLSEYELKMILFVKMDKSRSYLTHDKHQALYDALFKSLCLDDVIERGKSPAKTSKSSKYVTAKEPVKEPAFEMASDDIEKTIDDVPWFNNIVFAAKDPLIFDELMATPIDFSKFAMNRLKIDKLTKAHLVSPVYNLLKGTCQRDRCPYDLSKHIPLKGHPGRLTVPSEYFFNNELEYLKASDPENKYITSITKIKAARYELVGIEDMIPNLWSVTKKILSVVSVKINKLHGYGYLEEIVLFNLKVSDIVDLVVALHMFTRSLIIKRRVEDVQLGVESYQKKLNLTKPQHDFPRIFVKELYTPSALKLVRDKLHHRVLNFRLGYNNEMSRGKWSATDKRRSRLIVELIDKQMRERRILRNLERLVGARDLEMDYS
ncbi:hypothetical protein Tco_0949959, partial [Tanacetum coccineum]